MTEAPTKLSPSALPRHSNVAASALRALRDLALIVAGVLLALAADSWWSERSERRAEGVLLNVMTGELRQDLAKLARSLEAQRQAEAATVYLQEHLRNGTGYTAALDTVIGRVYGTGGVTLPATGAYEGLKSRGLEVVADDSLRIAITHYYENVLPAIGLANDINYNVNFEVIRPYFLANFRGVRPGASATPQDYAALMRNAYFDNLLVYRLEVLRTWLMPRYQAAVDDGSRLLGLLEMRNGRQ
jgi:hypothetical protein